ncbi:PIG-L deacetylase family protein [Alienimonas chondri]|uniref:N-acetyl-alpha-D-glucosaminyl L-malate deacetylase 1 n=1 Tax=Alienimonas chondri TaxID=2681879 RepID=A0ABX1VBW8_9PLAN|nr:PIG-L family deacetylase [Alienimonas chondri]NNJ25602.1 N-acetyl-alpha-D-glucosaminyl L-malate deacetylase 1 [Alienimonas chondri]
MNAARTDSSPPRVLAIHSHPDDLEILCGGTLCRLADLGCEIATATLTAGDLGSADLSREEIGALRTAESRRSAELLGASYECVGLYDLCITHDDASRRAVTAAVRRAKPDLILTAPPIDYMSDHEITSRLVRDAAFAASVPLYECGEPATERVPYLYYCDPVGHAGPLGEPWRPGIVVDVTGQIERKLELLACHDSQRAWLRRQHGIDEYLAGTRRWSAARGELIGVEYGEGFRQHLGHPHPTDDLLASLLSAVRPADII